MDNWPSWQAPLAKNGYGQYLLDLLERRSVR